MTMLLIVLLGIIGFGIGVVVGAVTPDTVLPVGVGPMLGLAAGCVGGFMLSRTMPRRTP